MKHETRMNFAASAVCGIHADIITTQMVCCEIDITETEVILGEDL